MKVIIGEDKMMGLMDLILKLSYNPDTREFYSNGAMDGVIGYKLKDEFIYAGYEVDIKMFYLFGKNVDELLLKYLKEKFPHLNINKIDE